MTIDKLNNGSFSEKDVNKSRKSGAARPADASQNAGKASSGKVRGDRFSPSGAQMGSDFDLATAELDKLRDSSFASLKEVKRKIDEGAYDSKDVHQKIGSLVEKDLQSIDQILAGMSGSDEVSADKKSLSPEYKKYLIENPKVVQKVADQIARDLSNI